MVGCHQYSRKGEFEVGGIGNFEKQMKKTCEFHLLHAIEHTNRISNQSKNRCGMGSQGRVIPHEVDGEGEYQKKLCYGSIATKLKQDRSIFVKKN